LSVHTARLTATDGNAVKVENSCGRRRSRAVESGKLHISYVEDDRAANGDSPLAARLSSLLAARCENAS